MDGNGVISTVHHDYIAGYVPGEHFLQTDITNVDTDLATGLLTVTTSTGALGSTPDNTSEWDTAYGWGDHASGGYLKADGSVALAGAWSMGNQATTNVNIDSGVIDGVTIGVNAVCTELRVDSFTINGTTISTSGSMSIQTPIIGTGTIIQMLSDELNFVAVCDDFIMGASAGNITLTSFLDTTIIASVLTLDAVDVDIISDLNVDITSGANHDITITTSGTGKFIISGDMQLNSGDFDLNGGLNASGNVVFQADLDVSGHTTVDRFTAIGDDGAAGVNGEGHQLTAGVGGTGFQSEGGGGPVLVVYGGTKGGAAGVGGRGGDFAILSGTGGIGENADGQGGDIHLETSTARGGGFGDGTFGNLYMLANGGGVRIGSSVTPTSTLAVTGTATFGDGGTTNYTGISATGDIMPKGSAFLVFQKASGNGIKVDQATPTFGFADLLGDQFSKNTGPTKPTLVAYNGVVEAWQFTDGDEAFLSYHIPHDYVLGTDIHLHIHWSQNAAGATGGTIDFKYFAIYAKGHNQASGSTFTSNPITDTFSSIDINDGNSGLNQYQQHITEVTISAATATAALFDRDDFEPDGVIELVLEMDSDNLTGTPSSPFIHYVDIHYQTTGVIGTKAKAPDFYA